MRPVLHDIEWENSLAVAERLLAHTRALARCRTPDQVAATLRATVTALTGTDLVYVGHRDPPDQPDTIILAGPDDGEPDQISSDLTGGIKAGAFPLSLASGLPLFLSSRTQINREFLPPERPPTTIRSLAVLPLRMGELIIGVLTIHHRNPREWTRSDRDFLTAVTDQSGPMLYRARLAVRKHPATQPLQRSILPPQLPCVPGLTLTARYQAAGRAELVGGDWYDSWTLSDGRVALVIGDVVGKGLEAAAAAGRLRASLRALAASDPSPGRVLTQLDRIEAVESSTMVATVLYTLYDADLRSVRIARAGHLPPVLIHPGQVPLLLEGHSNTPIGLAAAPIAEDRVTLRFGSTIVLYTDGLVEDRNRPLQDRLTDLLTALSTQLDPNDPDPLATHLMASFRTSHEDDAALLIATYAPTIRPGSGTT